MFLVITSSAGAVEKYCNEHVCVCVCLCVYVCSRAYPPKHTRDLCQIKFVVHVAYRRGSVLLRRGDAIPKEWVINLGVFSSLTMHCTAEHSGHIRKRLNRSRCRLARLMNRVGPG